MFSVGSIFYNLLTNRYLFASNKNEELFKLNKECDLSSIPENVASKSPECRDLLLKLLSKEPKDRPTAS